MTYIVQTFQLGSSTVVTLPKGLGIKPGQKLKVEKQGKKVILKEKKLSEVEVDKLVKKLSGHLKLERHLNAEELDLLYEESYK
ncbi:MAG: hypothetical protein UU73_C0002G0042 [Candidatus Daviesbacteria bacterium GW2011_GWA1_41_61]|uniref:SpoVT-AbrB domain-containing protein n=1 Tax=Candidatus Daviesbacteria bacterium GW2011_GWA2_40_9 TaxID=1618424 RepID=A0A0G0X7T7_9BACT|nr:MAG: hypothetical protein UU26_C0015G0024 [Candidatus Daviesbacteria bacterium GW2011_GWC1_40_9]KKR83702.1 MAG: hypothetical protein UU29_C0002G0015 [Candidatus Daviesbacteria bacterium GW2011_GWA2_40_9]KKR93702.1 MAG: hypothetical protein UU44_C0001G0042 [Candidatus Daviesbacteria bacterium GW2011_GWB1_41_15]KKS15168.1 MAG: hypothetical protein UU73_C0002G0042 [Candidatus Daviesbacteria bacterium GW2011_GWA1_41_61]